MDVLTQAALGSACAQIIFGKYNKHLPWIVGALSGMAADLDVYIRPSLAPMHLELWHRSFTHSLFFIPIGGLLIALCLMCFASCRAHWRLVIGASLAGYATHGILDAFTSYGTVLFWPWSNRRISWDIVAIVDLFFTIPLVLGTAWSVIFQDRKSAALGLSFAGLFLVFNAFQHQRALNEIERYASEKKISLSRIRAMPEFMSSSQWRVIAEKEACYFIADVQTPIIGNSKTKLIGQFKRFSPDMLPSYTTVNQQQDLRIFAWFADEYLILANRNPLIIADGRYTIGNQSVISLWGIKFLPHQTYVQRIRPVILKEQCN